MQSCANWINCFEKHDSNDIFGQKFSIEWKIRTFSVWNSFIVLQRTMLMRTSDYCGSLNRIFTDSSSPETGIKPERIAVSWRPVEGSSAPFASKHFFFYCTKSPVFVYSFWHGVCASDILVRMWRSIIRRPHKCWVPSWVEVHRNLDFIRNYKLLWSMQCYKLMTCCVWVWSLDWVHSSQRSRLDFFVVVYWFVLLARQNIVRLCRLFIVYRLFDCRWDFLTYGERWYAKMVYFTSLEKHLRSLGCDSFGIGLWHIQWNTKDG